MRFSTQDVCLAVVRAIFPSNNLRGYLENHPDLSIVSLIGILRSHFTERDSTSTFSELCNASQLTNDACQEFVICLIHLRQKVMILAHE